MKSKSRQRSAENAKNGAGGRPRKRSVRVAQPCTPAAPCDAAARDIPAVAMPLAHCCKSEADRRFDEWQRKYREVEVAILKGRDRRAESKRRRAVARRKAFGDLCEMTDGRAAFCRRTGMSLEEAERVLSRRRLPHPSLWLAWELGELAWFAISAIRREITRRIDRADHEAKRPFYYTQERARRQALAEERRKVRMRLTLNRCPTKKAVLDAWTHVKDSPEALLRFGSLIEDLECYVDNSLRRNENGEIVGRRPGIKGWLQLEIPALYLKYTTVMAYKAAAKRMRQVLDIRDPLPLSVALPDPTADGGEAECGSPEASANRRPGDGRKTGRTKASGSRRASDDAQVVGESQTKDYGAEEIQCHAGDGVKGRDTGCVDRVRSGDDRLRLCEADELDAMRARAVYLEVMGQVGGGRGSQTALFGRLKALTDPEAVADANMLQHWRSEYECKITVRTKSAWERRLRWTG